MRLLVDLLDVGRPPDSTFSRSRAIAAFVLRTRLVKYCSNAQHCNDRLYDGYTHRANTWLVAEGRVLLGVCFLVVIVGERAHAYGRYIHAFVGAVLDVALPFVNKQCTRPAAAIPDVVGRARVGLWPDLL